MISKVELKLLSAPQYRSEDIFCAAVSRYSGCGFSVALGFLFISTRSFLHDTVNIINPAITYQFMFLLIVLRLKFEIDIESITSYSGHRKIFQSLRIPVCKSSFGIDIGHIFMNDPEISAYKGNRSALQS